MASAFAAIDVWLRRLTSLLAVGGGVALTGLVGVTVIAVFWRYVLNDPIYGIEDVSTMALTVVVAASVAFGAQRGAHVSVNVIRFVGGRRLTRVTDIVCRILGTSIVALAAYALFVKGSCGLPCGAITNNLSIVHTPFYYFLGLAMALYAGVILLQLVVGITAWEGADPNEPDN
ncbi:MAG: TRAP transporter small permease [Rhodobacteraceae bacterium]|nr:TRAP transporter small permease [Paracoccaceae bacterium]